jgi:hypothetical protein
MAAAAVTMVVAHRLHRPMAAATMVVAHLRARGLRSRVGACRLVRRRLTVTSTARGSTICPTLLPADDFHNIAWLYKLLIFYDSRSDSKTNFLTDIIIFYFVFLSFPRLALLRKRLCSKCSRFLFLRGAEIFLRIYPYTVVANTHLRSLTLPSSPCPLHARTTFPAFSKFIIIHDNTRIYTIAQDRYWLSFGNEMV